MTKDILKIYMIQTLPKFPSDFCIETFDKTHIDELQIELIEQEMTRIYDLVMEQKNIKDAAVVSFKFSWNLSDESRRYILGEILERFPVVKYITGSHIREGCKYNSYDNVDLKYHSYFGHQYIISLTN